MSLQDILKVPSGSALSLQLQCHCQGAQGSASCSQAVPGSGSVVYDPSLWASISSCREAREIVEPFSSASGYLAISQYFFSGTLLLLQSLSKTEAQVLFDLRSPTCLGFLLTSLSQRRSF